MGPNESRRVEIELKLAQAQQATAEALLVILGDSSLNRSRPSSHSFLGDGSLNLSWEY